MTTITAKTMTTVATMTDPTPATTRRTRRRHAAPQRSMPTQTSKILVAGASATALLSMVTAMGWQSGTSDAGTSDPTAVSSSLPIPTGTVPPVLGTVSAGSRQPAAVVPVVVVPVAQHAVQAVSTQRASNVLTKSSG